MNSFAQISISKRFATIKSAMENWVSFQACQGFWLNDMKLQGNRPTIDVNLG